MEINDTAILQEILTLSKESAAADAKITEELSSVKENISQMKNRMDKQDILLEHLATQVNEQKRLTEEVSKLKELVKSQQDEIKNQKDEIKNIKEMPAQKALETQKRVTNKFFDSFLNMAVSAVTSAVIAILAKFFIFKQ